MKVQDFEVHFLLNQSEKVKTTNKEIDLQNSQRRKNNAVRRWVPKQRLLYGLMRFYHNRWWTTRDWEEWAVNIIYRQQKDEKILQEIGQQIVPAIKKVLALVNQEIIYQVFWTIASNHALKIILKILLLKLKKINVTKFQAYTQQKLFTHPAVICKHNNV